MTRPRSPAARIARGVLLFILVVSSVASSDTTPDPTDGTWSALPPPQARHGHTAVHDAARDRLVLFGGYGEIRRSDVWGFSLADGQWARLIPSGVRPAERFGHSALIDPLRDRMIVCGGEVEAGADWLSDLHVLSLVPEPSWSPLAALGPAPPGRMEHTAVLDAPRDRMIVFGGRAGPAVWDDVWALVLGDTPRWERIEAAEPRPARRSGHVAIVDAEADRMIVFGGSDGTMTLGDLWQLTLTGEPEWTEIVAGGEAPPPLARATGVFDPAQRRLLVFGGMESGGALSAATYSLDVETMTWSRLDPAGTLPSHRYRHATAFDAARGRMVVIGGSDPSLENDVWSLDAGASPHWTEVSDLGTPGPSRWAPTLVYEPVGDRMLVFGGMPAADCCTYFRTDTRALRLGGAPRWSGVTTTGPAPGVVLHTTIYDPVRDRLVLFGGLTGGEVVNTTWTLALDQTPPVWSSLAVGAPPGARSQHVAVYDSRRDRMIIFGGAYFGPGGMRPWADAWALSLSGTPTWSLLMPEGTGPTARGLSAAIYDPVRDRMLVYGGSGTHETWELTLAGTPQWRLIATTGDAPAAPQMCGAIYDPIRDRMVVRGGIDASSGHTTNVWALSLDDHRWTHLAPGGPILPATRDDDHFVYDPRRDRIIAHGGWDPPDGLGDTWMLTWGTPTTPGIDFLDPPEWSGSSPVVVKLEVENPLDGTRVIEWSLSIDRDFPGLPMRGQVLVGSVSTMSFNIEVSVPPGVSAVDAQIVARAWFAGALGNDSHADRIVQDGTTATLASLVSAEVAPGRARLVWNVAARPNIGIERRVPDSEWRAIAERPAHDGLVEIVDASVEPGRRYGYRLAWRDAGGPVVVAGEQWVDVPATLALALHGGRPNPARDRFGVAFTLPSRGRAKLEVFDLAGRRLASYALDRDAGFHVAPMPESASWPAGVYLVRLGFEARVLEARIAIVR